MENTDAGMLGGVIALGVVFCMFAIGFAVVAFTLAGLWKMFVKAGQPGWASLVPFYNLYLMVQIVGLPVVWFYYFIILTVVGSVLPVVVFFTSIGTLVLSYYLVRMLHRAYGLNADTVNVIISMFLPFILTYRAGFGPTKYLGPQSVHDVPNLPWLSNASQSNTVQSPPQSQYAEGSAIPTLSTSQPTETSFQPTETPLVNNQPTNVPPVSGGPTDPGVDMGSLPQMGSNKDQQQQ